MVSQKEIDTRITTAIAKQASIAEERDTKGRKAKKVEQGQGGCFCRQEKRGMGRKGKTSHKLCSCGYKCRGKNHETGTHHRQGKPK
jgi:hypothetical protein